MASEKNVVLRDTLIDLVTSVVVGAVSIYGFDLGRDASFVCGILLFVAIQIVRGNLQSIEIREKLDRTLGFLSAKNAHDAFGELRLLYHHRGVGSLSETAIDVPAEKMLDLWRDAFTRTKSTWSALQFAPAGETWGLGWGKSAAAFVQEERIKAGCTVERIFVYESPEKQKNWEAIRAMQTQIGIKILQVNQHDLFASNGIKQREKQIGTWDIAIADASLVFLIFLDARGECKHARLTNDPQTLENAQFILSEARSLAL